MSILSKIKLRELNGKPVSRDMYEEGIRELTEEMREIFSGLSEKQKEKINKDCENHKKRFQDKYKNILDNLSPIPAVKMKTLVNVMLQKSRQFEQLDDKEIFDFVMGDFYDLYFELEVAVEEFMELNEAAARKSMTFLMESDGADVRLSAEKVQDALENINNLLPCKSDSDVEEVFKFHSILASYMQNFLSKEML